MTIAVIKQRIIDWIKTGVPKNIKSNNIRTLFQELTKKTPDVDNFTLGKIYAIGKNNNLDRELLSIEISPLQYTFQDLTIEQQSQALENLGIVTILIEGKKYTFYKKPGNNQPYPEAGDTAILGWFSDNTFRIILEYVSGEPELFTSWRVPSWFGRIEFVDDLPEIGIINILYLRRSDNTEWRWQLGGTVLFPESRWIQIGVKTHEFVYDGNNLNQTLTQPIYLIIDIQIGGLGGFDDDISLFTPGTSQITMKSDNLLNGMKVKLIYR